MNGCMQIDFNFSSGKYFNTSCDITDNVHSDYVVSYYTNISKFTFDRGVGTGAPVRICKYTLDKKLIGLVNISYQEGHNVIELDPNYLYRFSYNNVLNTNFKGYQCNIGVGSMANELAFGKLTFLDQVNTIIPFVIPLIAFALGFLLLKKMIKRGSHGHV